MRARGENIDLLWQHPQVFWFFLFVFFLAALCHMEFPGQGSDPSCRFDLSHSCSNARSFTHCAGPGIKPASQQSQEAADPVTAQWELLASSGITRESARLTLQKLNTCVVIVIIIRLFRAAPVPYGSCEARGRLGAAANDLRHSHSKVGSQSPLQPTPQLTTTPDL